MSVQKWEYQCVRFSTEASLEFERQSLSEMGQLGWELVSAIIVEEQRQVYLRRPLETSQKASADDDDRRRWCIDKMKSMTPEPWCGRFNPSLMLTEATASTTSHYLCELCAKALAAALLSRAGVPHDNAP